MWSIKIELSAIVRIVWQNNDFELLESVFGTGWEKCKLLLYSIIITSVYVWVDHNICN